MTKRTKKRIAALLAVVLCACLMSVPVLAVEDEIPVGTIIDIFDEPVPLAPDGDIGEEFEDAGETVPLASVPVTGDGSLLPAVLAALSGTGLAGLALAGRNRRDAV